ncbi:MAG: hypothetical protein H7A46_01580 [Verrucomicrobiales bacterium]|nr:hypothetical protein [Verrucomicrobiales bacterium]
MNTEPHAALFRRHLRQAGNITPASSAATGKAVKWTLVGLVCLTTCLPCLRAVDPEIDLDLEQCRIATLHEGKLHVLAPQRGHRWTEWGMIARLEDGRWLWLPEALKGGVTCLHSWRGQLLVGGATGSTHDDRERALRVWNGDAWEAAFGLDEAARLDGRIELMAGTDHDDLTVAGKGLRIGPGKPIRVARWNGRAWKALGQGPPVRTDASLKSLVVAPNGMTYLLVEEFHPTRRWVLWHWAETVGWRALPGGQQKNHLAVTSDGELYVAGRFFPPLVSTHCLIARWDGKRWHELAGRLTHPGGPEPGSSVSIEVSALGTWRNQLVVGGGFRQSGEVTANLIALWDGHSWTNLGEGLGGTSMWHLDGKQGPLYFEDHYPALLPSDEDALYAIGRLDRAGTVAVRGLARWNGKDWDNPLAGPASETRVNP